MKLKQRPEDFSVREAYRFDQDPRGDWRVYLMDKQKLSTFEAVERLKLKFRLTSQQVSFCGLKDKQGRTEQLVAVEGKDVALQDPDLRLKPLGRTAAPLSARNLTANRFAVTVRELTDDDLARVPSAVAELRRVGLVNYFDSQRFGAVKHGQGFIAKDLVRNNFEHALHNYLAKPSPLDQSEDAKVKAFWKEHWGDWQRHCPYKAVSRYRLVLNHLREHPTDWPGAFLRIDPKYRALLVFEYQSYLWNEGVKALLRRLLPQDELVSLPYQAGRLLFHRDGPAAVLAELRKRTFPLLAPDAPLRDPLVRAAVQEVLDREKLRLADLALRKLPSLFFKYEERPVVVSPGKLVVSDPKHDELNRGFAKVNIAFTLPPGAYATLLVKRLFWFDVLAEESERSGEVHPAAERALEAAFGPGAAKPRREAEEPKPRPPPAPKLGFREEQKRKKEAKAQARADASRRGAARPAKRAAKQPAKKAKR